MSYKSICLERGHALKKECLMGGHVLMGVHVFRMAVGDVFLECMFYRIAYFTG